MNLPTPMVDVVIPTYNYGDKVGRAINSVMEQTLSNFACYIVDDGSTDNTQEVVPELIKNDKRFHFIHKGNGGVATARNAGVSAGEGKYICCLDADDMIDPRYLDICVDELERDRTISIAYTGLWYIKPDKSEGLSQWPDAFNYDKQLEGKNQIPTCCVLKREVWERLGGQRNRYSVGGAGEEDAEFWLRAGAYGFRAKKITDAGLFIYSWMTGRVSGGKDHKTTDWLSYHPWVYDGMHPFMSLATPAKHSHPVRQYDEPIVSVVIPVGPGHEEVIIDALDSLEAQSYRNWEVIVVWDNPNLEAQKKITRVYPYIKLVPLIFVDKGYGAGYARNRGAEAARGDFLVFLDADDWLAQNALERMLNGWERSESIIYTDHIGKAEMSPEEAQKLGERLITYNPTNNNALFWHGWKDYNCELAQRQPNLELYHWCLVTTLIPKEWHFSIGGFDESMPSWEDWDYYIRMAHRGYCFARIPEKLVVYRYYTGNRREEGMHDAQKLIQYMLNKYSGVELMGCNCKDKNNSILMTMNAPQMEQQQDLLKGNSMSDSDFILISYDHPNRGQHRVIGSSTGIDYGYRAGGDKFLAHRNDISSMPHIFKIVSTVKPQSIQEEKKVVEPPKPVEEEEEEKEPDFDLQVVAGVSPTIAQNLNAKGVHTLEELIAFGGDKLTEMKGIGERRAEAILASAIKMREELKVTG